MHLWGQFEDTLRVFWLYEAYFEVTLGHSGVTLASLWDTFGALVATLGPRWRHIGATLGHFGVT